jgi:hypothetical protein
MDPRTTKDKMNIDNFISSKEEGYDHDPNFIPNNEHGIIKNPNYFACKVTMATELAIGDYQQHNQPYEYIDSIMQRYHQAKAEGYKSPLGLHNQYYHDELKKTEDYKKKGYFQGTFFKWIKPEPYNWKSKVPKEYHQFGSVFSEEEAQRFPKSKPYDHAIDLHSDAPATLDCKVYPLAPMEQGALEEFIKEHLKKKYIWPSKS